MSSLADVILGDPDDTARVPQLRQGVVTAASPLTVLVGAATTAKACRALASYVPTVGDAVSVLVIAGDRLVLGRATPTPTGGGPPVDVTQFVKKTGDIMSGGLEIQNSGQALVLRNQGAYISWWDGGTRLGYLQGVGGGLTMNAEAGSRSIELIGSQVIVRGSQWMAGTNVLLWPDYGGGWYMTDSTYMRCYGDKTIYTAGGVRTDGALYVGGGTDLRDTTVGHLYTRANYRIYSDGTYSGQWTDAGVVLQNGTNELRCSMSMHVRGIFAMAIGCTSGGGLGIWNNGSGGYEQVSAAAFNVASSRTYKQDVTAWPARSAGAAVMGAASRLSLIDVVQYRQLEREALSDPLPDGSLAPHDCDDSDCEGSGDAPCFRVLDWRNPHLGIIVEDLATVLPEAVAYTPSGKPDGMRVASMIGYLLAVCKEQQERLEALEQHHQEAA